MRSPLALTAGLALLVAGCAGSGFDSGLSGVLGLLEPTEVAGVREALRIGAERAVSQTSRPGGFLDDPRVRIGLPAELRQIAAGLRAVGLRGTVDEIEVSMNRAAEQASGAAADVLFDAVAGLSIADALAIVEGDDDAATRYFRAGSEDALRARFAPIVAAEMKRVGLYRAYAELIERNRLVNLLGEPDLDLDAYVTQLTLDGLFAVLREEEGRIRRDPSARTTALLRAVFGGV